MEQISEPLDLQTKVPNSHSDIVAEILISTPTSQTQIEVEISNIQPGSGQGPQPPITLAASSEPDCASRTGRLQTQDSYDSLRTVVHHDDRTSSPVDSETSERDSVLFKDLPGIAEEDWVSDDGVHENKKPEAPEPNTLNKTSESLFGGPTREKGIPDHFVNKRDSPAFTQLEPQRKPDLPFPHPDKSLTESSQTPDNTSSHTPSSDLIKPNLPIIAESESKDDIKYNPNSIVSAERSFISAEDLLARLAVQPAHKLTTIPDQFIVNPKVRLPSEKKMDLLKRERRRPTPPSLRRAGSQIESPNASSENIIFGGERYQTPEIKGKGKEVIKRTDIYVRSCSIKSFNPL